MKNLKTKRMNQKNKSPHLKQNIQIWKITLTTKI